MSSNRIALTFGRPLSEWQRSGDQRAHLKVAGEYTTRGTLSSGFAQEHIQRVRVERHRRRAARRLALATIVFGVAVAVASPFTTNRLVDGMGRGFGAVLGGIALLALAARGAGD